MALRYLKCMVICTHGMHTDFRCCHGFSCGNTAYTISFKTGIGMALYENVQYTDYGRMMNNSLMQYKIPARVDVCRLRVEFESSYEQSGPFGAKSIGEIVINTPSPALAHAVANATGIWVRELPITPEKIAMGTPEE